jgi:hypothetical protein
LLPACKLHQGGEAELKFAAMGEGTQAPLPFPGRKDLPRMASSQPITWLDAPTISASGAMLTSGLQLPGQ